MITQGTKIKIIDNSGGKIGLCIKLLNHRQRANIGDKIIVVIKRARPNKRIKQHQIAKAIIVRTATNQRRTDGSYLSWGTSACILTNKQNQPLGKRILGPVSKDLRLQGHLKLISIASQAI